MYKKIIGILICMLFVVSSFASAVNVNKDIFINHQQNEILSNEHLITDSGLVTWTEFKPAKANTDHSYSSCYDELNEGVYFGPIRWFKGDSGCNCELGAIGGYVDVSAYEDCQQGGDASAWQNVIFYTGRSKTVHIAAETYLIHSLDFSGNPHEDYWNCYIGHKIADGNPVWDITVGVDPLDFWETIVAILVNLIGAYGGLFSKLILATDFAFFHSKMIESAEIYTSTFNMDTEIGYNKISIGTYTEALAINSCTNTSFLGLVNKITVDGIAPPDTPTITGPDSGFIDETYDFSIDCVDPNNDDIQYGFDWNGDSIVDEWTDYHVSSETVSVTHGFSEGGTHEINVVARDIDLMVSEESSFIIHINLAPYKPTVWDPNPNDDYVGVRQYFWAETTDYDNDMISYRFDFGDGTEISDWSAYRYSGSACSSEEICGLHIFSEEDEYEIKAQAKDDHGNIGEWSDPYIITITRRGEDSKPIMETLDATEIEETSVRLNGKIIYDGGYPCEVGFRFREKNEQDWNYHWISSGDHTSGYEFYGYAWHQHGITYDTTYEYQAGARNDKSEGWGETKEFTTKPLFVPSVETLQPEFDSSVNLRGKIIDNGGYCSGKFRYRLVGATQWSPGPNGGGDLENGEIFYCYMDFEDFTHEAYEYQACAFNYAGETWGETIEFITPNWPPDPPRLRTPEDGKKVGQKSRIEISVVISDPNEDCMDVYFYDDSDNLIGKVIDEKYVAWVEWNDLSYDTTYLWYTVANDRHGLETRGPAEGYWSFSTVKKSRSNAVILKDFFSRFPVLEKLLQYSIFQRLLNLK